MVQEHKEIQEQFNKVLAYSQEWDIDKINTDPIFMEWMRNKQWFLETTNSLIYEIPEPITFDLSEDEKIDKITNFLSWIYNNYGEEMCNFFDKEYADIYNNVLLKDRYGFTAGTRLSKAFMKHFSDRLEEAEQVRQKLSMVIQESKVNGKLCLSIHPLDFLSASENSHNWRSCHALDGEYRVGNVSYMEDDCTIIAYLKSDNDTKLPHFPQDIPWNSKKWRCYFYIDKINHIIYAGKQYPFESKNALDILAQIFHKLGYFHNKEEQKILTSRYSQFCYGEEKELTWDKYIDIRLPRYSFIPAGMKGDVEINGRIWNFAETKVIVGEDACKIVPMKNYVGNDPDACCYNDVIQSTTYSPWVMPYERYYVPDSIAQKLIVGKGVKCVCCNRHNVADSDIFFCEYCRDDEVVCCNCGYSSYPSYMIYDDSGRWYCPDCYDDMHNID